MDDTNEALKIWDALKPMVDREIKERTASCIRSKKMTVTSAPNGTTIGVCEPFDTVTYNIPYSSAVKGAQVGDAVWVQWYFDNASTMIAVCYGDGLNDYNIPSFPLSIANGGTGQTTVAAARNAFGLGNTSGALPIANGGTGATTKANAKTALDIDDLEDSIGTFKTVTKTLNANSNVTFTFDGFCSFCVLISGSVVGVRCILMGHCSTAGNVVVSKYSFGSTDNITTDVTATNKLKISNAASNAGYVRLIRVSSSGTMPT